MKSWLLIFQACKNQVNLPQVIIFFTIQNGRLAKANEFPHNEVVSYQSLVQCGPVIDYYGTVFGTLMYHFVLNWSIPDKYLINFSANIAISGIPIKLCLSLVQVKSSEKPIFARRNYNGIFREAYEENENCDFNAKDDMATCRDLNFLKLIYHNVTVHILSSLLSFVKHNQETWKNHPYRQKI